MNIIRDKRQTRKVEFGTLNVGDIFEYMLNYYIVIDILYTDCESDVNAICLENGETECFSCNDEVIPCKVEINIIE